MTVSGKHSHKTAAFTSNLMRGSSHISPEWKNSHWWSIIGAKSEDPLKPPNTIVL